jgi:hypothetical protein
MPKTLIRPILKKTLELSNSTLTAFGYEIRVRRPQVLIDSPCHELVPDLDMLVSHLLLRLQPNPYFIQIGAFDGVANDPLHKIVLRHHLSGIVIEPQQDAFAALQRNYAKEPQVVCENVAISSNSGQITFYTIDPEALQKYPMSRQLATIAI